MRSESWRGYRTWRVELTNWSGSNSVPQRTGEKAYLLPVAETHSALIALMVVPSAACVISVSRSLITFQKTESAQRQNVRGRCGVPEVLRLANIRNGLVYPHDDVCNFQSQHGHQLKCGYFRIDAMPYSAVIHLLRGGEIEIIDATRRDKPLSDALKFGVTTWCMVFNRALNCRGIRVCYWETREMRNAASSSIHRPLVQTIRKLAALYGAEWPARIGINVHLACHSGATFDDDVKALRAKVAKVE